MELWVWSIVLLAIGLAIVLLELFIPSGGMLGIFAAAAIVGSLVVAFLSGLKFGVTMLLVTSVLVPIVLASALKWWPHTPMGQRILASPPESEDDVLPDTDPRYELRAMIGKPGVAKTKMLPSGIVVVDGRTYDAVGDGMAIEPGQEVTVVGVDMNRLEVRPSTPSTGPTLPTGRAAGQAASQARSRATSQSGDDLLARPLESFGLEPLDDPRT